ncbi:heavy-metal-associated domain-containing protein [Bacillus sp. EB106-08-02-XG196]|jgi:copper chaperone|uniref:heavy-metal-associated domain-containing protein n=1 Tax=Bacillus sp. EB106-08-02-XG196 TaxID=2737049 RepID=UPI0015C4A660|nr:heavy metal-associated domain-containing protein [Bacillus sp. EB106-08-02-XG196]NWQ42480.1 heavy-metal-associated domain-containing protein [Bacillus sp. EB106-08-02-XG196]
MAKALFQLETLTCPSCIKKIETTLTKTAGIESAKVIFNSSKVKTEFNEVLVNASQIEEKIKKLGYEVLTSKIS